jgi:hypothetical protein
MARRWCQHRIAANLQRSVERVLARRQEPEPPVPGVPDLEPWPDNDPEGEPDHEDWKKSTPIVPAPALPEAPVSCNVHVTIAGRQVQVTLRGVDEVEVLQRLERLLAQYPVPQPQPQAQPGPSQKAEGWCTSHNVPMKWNEGKQGKRGWFSHRTQHGWCNGTPKVD